MSACIKVLINISSNQTEIKSYWRQQIQFLTQNKWWILMANLILWSFFKEKLILKTNSIWSWCILFECNTFRILEPFSSVQFSCSVMSDSLQPHESQQARPPCPSPTPGVHWDSRPSSWWCHSAISSSVVPFSSCPQSLPASESFPMSQLFAWSLHCLNKAELGCESRLERQNEERQ